MKERERETDSKTERRAEREKLRKGKKICRKRDALRPVKYERDTGRRNDAEERKNRPEGREEKEEDDEEE